MSFGTVPNALVVVAIVVVVIARRPSWSELGNSDADVWRCPVLMIGVGIYQMYDKHLHLGVADVVLLVAGAGVALVAGGLSNPEIAKQLFISEATVKTHINNTFAKIGARHRAEAVRYAYRNGIAES